MGLCSLGIGTIVGLVLHFCCCVVSFRLRTTILKVGQVINEKGGKKKIDLNVTIKITNENVLFGCNEYMCSTLRNASVSQS